MQIRRVILLLISFLLLHGVLYSQHTSRDNYTGDWESPSSWNPQWATPNTNITQGDTITINGYITVNGPLSFSWLSSKLIINDTLVIKGNLFLCNLNALTINDNGILIVRGNLTICNYTNIVSNGYFIITGNISEFFSIHQGSFTSNDNPVKVFIGGTISSSELSNNLPNYPALNCTAPTTVRYVNSNCSYGNMTDILTDPIYPFFQSTCPITTPVITPSGPLTFCSGGSVTLTSSSASTYLWSNGATTPSINVTTSGSYSVRVTNSSGCHSEPSMVTEIAVNEIPATPTITTDGPATFCEGGSVRLTSSSGTSYLWSNGATTQSINVTSSGSYTVRVTNSSGCQSATSVAIIVTVNALPSTPNITAGGPTTFCDGGSVTLTSSSGSTYLWSNGATTSSIVVTTAGNYTVRVADANGCQSAASAAAVVSVNALPPIPTITAGGPTTFCTGASVTLSSSPGSGYLWSNGATTQSISVTTTGNYSVRVTNADGCQSTSSLPVSITVKPLPATPTITASGPTTFCSGGNVILTSSGGSTYLWSNGATTQSIDVTTTGNYSVIVTNADGCQSAASAPTAVTRNNLPPKPTITANGPSTFCAGGNVTLTSSSAVGYIWSNGQTTRNITVNTTGSFTVRVINANGCLSVASNAFPVTVNPLPVVDAGIDVSIPNGTSTSLNSTVAGTGPFTYNWSPSTQLVNPSVEDPATINLSVTTTFTLTATSTSTACSATDGVTVTTTGGALTSIPTATPGIVCTGNSVQLRAEASGGSGTYTYSWSSAPTGFTSNNANPIVNPSVNTTYNVAVFDGFTTVNAQVTVTVNTLPGIPAITANGPTTFCSGGSITLTSSAGTTYLWSNGETTQSINVVSTGNYSVQVTNSSGCRSMASTPVLVTVNDKPVTPSITAGGALSFCEGESVTLTSNAGAGYIWSNGETTQSINVSTSGSYTVQILNSEGCHSEVSSATSVIVKALPLTPTISAGGPTTFCDGESVTLTSSPGTGYIWSNGETTQAISVFTAGNYSVRVADANGCMSPASLSTVVTINPLPAIPTITAGGSLIFCEGGSVDLTSSIATGYLWSNGETTQAINASNTGSYSVRVINLDGCRSLSSVATNITVNSLPQTPTITASSPTTFCAGGNVILTSSSGTSYLWSDGETSQSINVTRAGNYTVQITNAVGCQSALSVGTLITVNALPVTTAGNNGPVCAGGPLNLTSSSSDMISYSWTGPGGFTSKLQNPTVSATVTSAMSGTYTVMVTSPSGCTIKSSTDVIVNTLPVVMITSSNSPMCINESRNLTGSPAGGTFIITEGPGTVTGNVLSATGTGTINLVYDYNNVCRNFSTQSIIINSIPVANAGPDQELKSVFEAQMKAQLSLSERGEWSLISGSGNINDIHSPTTRVTDLSKGNNLFLWKVSNGNCEATDEVSILVDDIFTPTVITPNEDGQNDKLVFPGLMEFPGSTLIIYNRWGVEVYRSRDYNNDWDGKDLKKRDLGEDTYYYILRLSNDRILKGFIEIIR